MSSAPVHHSQAQGIHPASFVQPTAPDTAGLQDGTEWTDTSAGPPYVRKVWRAATSTWGVLQMDATGYPLPRGHRLDTLLADTSDLLADPGFELPALGAGAQWDAPTAGPPVSPPGSPWVFHVSGGVASGIGNNGSPIVGTAGLAPQGVQVVYLAPGAKILQDFTLASAFSAPVAFSASLNGPTGDATVGQVFIDVWSGDTRLYHEFATIAHALGYQRYTLPVLTLAPGSYELTLVFVGSTDSDVLVDGIATGEMIRLVHAGGTTDWEHDSHTFRVKSGGVDALVAPLPVLSATPATLLGQDPATLLPAFCPAPNPIVATAVLQQTTEQPAPSATTCTQVRCGAATALRDHLNDWYQNVRNILNAALNTLGMALGSLLVDTGTAFFVALTEGVDIELAPEVYNLLKLVLKAVPGVTGAVLQAGFALLSTSQLEWLRTKAYCHITCSANQITLTQEQVFAWHDDIAADTTILSGIQRDVCAAIVAWGANWSLSAWAQQAQTGAGLPTHDCDAYVCP